MAGDALRQVLASFTIEVDRDGALARGNAGVDALKLKLSSVDGAAKQASASLDALYQKAKALYALRMGGGGGAPMLGAGEPGGALARVQAGGALARRGVAGLLGSGSIDTVGTEASRGAVGLSKFQRAVDGIRTSLNTPRLGFIPALFTMQNAIRGAFAAAGVGALLHVIDEIGGIGEQAAKLGVTNEEFQRLDVLAKQNATSVGALGTVFRTLANAAVQPTKETTAAFAKLGVVTKQSDGTFKSRQDLFFETAGALADVSDATQRAALAQDVFGRGAIEVLPLLANGRKGIDEQRAALEKLAVVSDSTIAAADSFSDSLPALKLQLMALAGPILEKLVIPALEVLRDTVITLADWWGKLTKSLSLSTIAFAGVVLALTPIISQMRLLVALGGGWTKVLKNIGSGAKGLVRDFAPLIGAFIILEDLFGFFAGKRSLIGRGLEKAFGPGLKKTVDDIRDAFKDLWKWILGDGAGDKAKALISEIGQGLRLMVNDALALIPGSGRTAGLAGLEAYEANQTRAQARSDGALAQANGAPDPFLTGQFGGSNLLAVPGAYGPPAPPVIDQSTRNVTVNMGASTDPNAVATRVGQVLDRDRNALVSGVP